MKEKTCAFTGHRPQKLPFGFNEADERCTALKKLLRTKIIEYIETEHVTHFISGMALGTDMYAAEIVLGLKAAYPGITLTCARERRRSCGLRRGHTARVLPCAAGSARQSFRFQKKELHYGTYQRSIGRRRRRDGRPVEGVFLL